MTSLGRHRAVLDLATNMLDGDLNTQRQGVKTLEWLARSRFREIRAAAVRAMAEAAS